MNIEPRKEGNQVNIIVVNGFLSEKMDHLEDWNSLIEGHFPSYTVHQYDWDACNYVTVINELITGDFLNSVGDLFVTGVTVGSIAKVITSTVGSGYKQWLSATEKSMLAGKDLASYIENRDGRFILLGHSLGVKVIYHCLDSLKATNKIVASVLLGGAVDANEKWGEFLQKHNQTFILNCYSSNDSVLQTLYPIGTLKTNPVGLNPIEQDYPDRLRNIDMSTVVSGHMEYKKSEVGKLLKANMIELQSAHNDQYSGIAHTSKTESRDCEEDLTALLESFISEADNATNPTHDDQYLGIAHISKPKYIDCEEDLTALLESFISEVDNATKPYS